jgi:hypothetical protein
MNTLCKTELGTIGAFRWNNGIGFGIYPKGNFASFEYDEKRNKLMLKIQYEKAKADGIEVVAINDKWEVIK